VVVCGVCGSPSPSVKCIHTHTHPPHCVTFGNDCSLQLQCGWVSSGCVFLFQEVLMGPWAINTYSWNQEPSSLPPSVVRTCVLVSKSTWNKNQWKESYLWRLSLPSVIMPPHDNSCSAFQTARHFVSAVWWRNIPSTVVAADLVSSGP